LAKTIEAGDDYALLQHIMNWKAGQKVVVVTTTVLDSTICVARE